MIFLLDEEFSHISHARKFEEKFLEIIEMLNEKKINQNEFFEEDSLVKGLLKVILEKLLRNMNSIKAKAYEIEIQHVNESFNS
jgi:hypothetical protein